MISQPIEKRSKFAEFFEPTLLDELETKSMIMEVKSGDVMPTLVRQSELYRSW